MQTQISPKLILLFNIVLIVISALAAGSLWHPHWMSADTADDIHNGSTFSLPVLLAIRALFTPNGAAPIRAPAKTLCLAIVGALLGVMLLTPVAPAEAAPKTLAQIVADLNTKFATLNGKVTTIGAKVGLTGSVTTDANALVAKIQAISLADLRAAKDDADKTKDTLAASCYAPLIDLVAAQQSVVAPGQNTDNPGASVPTTHLILDFQRGRDFYNALRPGSTVSIGCAPLAEQVKLDVVTLIGQIAAGTLSMASFGL